MRPVLLVDFGSTFTKVTAIELDGYKLLGTAQDFTTAGTDISDGLQGALQKLEAKTGRLNYVKRLACSSAAGGLKMIACGLVPSLTAEAARMAALGAGAKVARTYSYQLTRSDAEEIARLSPDVFLLTGGTDGGNRENILHNARILSEIEAPFPVVLAGNRAALDECAEILRASCHEVIPTENVMPAFNQLNILPAQKAIREVFLRRIVKGKGLDKAQKYLDAVAMPTPAAVLRALTLLSKGLEKREGIGELMAVDLGGATTDVYSIASGLPSDPSTLLHGLPEPYEKRTVEGDIGMRFSARGVLEACGMQAIAALSGLSEAKIDKLLADIDNDKSLVPSGDEMEKLDYALAALAIRTGIRRHAGSVIEAYTPVGPVFQQTGKDLTRVRTLILTGGALIHAVSCAQIARVALSTPLPGSLAPAFARPVLDRHYILSAMGLLADIDEEGALTMLLNTFGKEEG